LERFTDSCISRAQEGEGDGRGRAVAALVTLADKEPVTRVQVRELCSCAKVSRSWFYQRFEGMPGFVHAIIEDFLREMNEEFSSDNIFIHMMDIDSTDTYIKCVEFMVRRKRFVEVMIGPNGTPELRGRVTGLWEQQLEEALVMRVPSIQNEVNFEILSCYVCTAMWGMLEWSVLNAEKYDVAFMGRQMAHLVYDCTLRQLVKQRENEE
jgi:hypothetical protein